MADFVCGNWLNWGRTKLTINATLGLVLANVAGIKKARANKMVAPVIETVRRWPDLAEKAGVADSRMAKIQACQRTNLYVVEELLNRPGARNSAAPYIPSPFAGSAYRFPLGLRC